MNRKIAVAFILILAAGAVYQRLTILGGTALSVDRVEIVTDPALGYEEAFLVTIVANQGGEVLTATLTADDLARYGITGYKAGTFKITVSLEDVAFVYPLLEDTRPDGGATIVYKVYGSTAKEDSLDEALPFDEVGLTSTLDYARGTPGGDLVTSIPSLLPRGVDWRAPLISWKGSVELGEWGYWMPEEGVTVVHSTQGGRRVSTDVSPLPGESGTELGGGMGDWYVTNLAGVAYARGLRIGTQAMIDYRVRVTVVNEAGETITTLITPDHNVASLMDIGRAKLAGSLISNILPPQPAVDYAVIQYTENIPTTTTKYGAALKPYGYKFISRYLLDTYKSTLTGLEGLDNNYYTYENTEFWQEINPGGESGSFNVPAGAASWTVNTGLPGNTEVRVINAGGGVTWTGRTDSAGRITVNVNPGSYTWERPPPPPRTRRRDPGIGAAEIIGDWNALNGLLGDMVEDGNAPYEGGTYTIVGGTLRFEPSGMTISPMLQILLKASWVGVEILSGRPSIVSISRDTIYMGETGTALVKVRNNGEVDDSFDVTLEGEGVNAQSRRVAVRSGETVEVPMTYGADVGEHRVTVSVRSVNDPEAFDENEVTLIVAERPLPGDGPDWPWDDPVSLAGIGFAVVVILAVAYARRV